MRIIVDAMGGDNAPDAVIQAVAEAKKEYGAEFVLVGKNEVISERIKALGLSETLSDCRIADARETIEMCDSPLSVRHKKDSSMAVALCLLRDGEGDALVSAGNTGALLVGATLFVRCIKGIKRAALAPIFPTKTGKMMIVDSGANLDCTPDMLNQFAVMGSVYMNKAQGLEKPRVGLANNGEEETKGTPLYVSAHKLLKNNKDINFVGNIEGRGVLMGECDVLVCDGFSGNLILKTCEGAGLMMRESLSELFYKNLISKLGALCVLPGIKALRKRMDYKEIGGAVLLGISRPVIKAHGNSDSRGFKSAIRQAIGFVNSDVVSVISEIAPALAKSEAENEEK